MRIRIALTLALLSLTACHWAPVVPRAQTSPTALHSPQAAPLPSQLHTLLSAKGRW